MLAQRTNRDVAYEVTIEEGGVIRLPQELQDRLGVPVGDIIRVVLTDGGLQFKTALVVPDVSERLTELMEAQGVTLEELMEDQEATSEALFKERCGGLIKQD
jgi:bifunctional DNA-binding transcriptional regulator/antitoxin component of YhaV-PrlF toxin-antitoxin module